MRLGLGVGLSNISSVPDPFADGFHLTVDTTKAGSASNTFVLPTPGSGTYNYWVDWGEGGEAVHITANTSQTHIYSVPGTYTIKIRGTFPYIYFNNTGDKLKLLGVQIGNVGWTFFVRSFYGCSNLVTFSVVGDTSAVTNMSYMFYGCTAFNQPVSGLDTSKVTNMSFMFAVCSSLKQSLATFAMGLVTNVLNMCYGCNLNATGTTTNYDATLIAWAAQDLVNSLTITFGTSKYGAGAGATARAAIISDDLWTITDGGQA